MLQIRQGYSEMLWVLQKCQEDEEYTVIWEKNEVFPADHYNLHSYKIPGSDDWGFGFVWGFFSSFQGLKDLLNPCVYLAWWEQTVLLPCRITTVYFILWKGTELWRTPLALQLPPLASHLDQHWGRCSNLHFVRGSGVKLSFSITQSLPHFRKPERIM